MDHVRNILSSLKGRGAVFFGGYALYLVFSFMAFHSATLTSVSLAIGHDGNVVFSASAMAARIGVCALCVGVVWRLGTKGRLAAPRPFEWTLLVAAIAFLLGGMLVLAVILEASPMPSRLPRSRCGWECPGPCWDAAMCS